MTSFRVCGVALPGYAIFFRWCVNWRGPLSRAEVDALIARMVASGVGRGDPAGSGLALALVATLVQNGMLLRGSA